jgi:hypothetical protein
MTIIWLPKNPVDMDYERYGLRGFNRKVLTIVLEIGTYVILLHDHGFKRPP